MRDGTSRPGRHTTYGPLNDKKWSDKLEITPQDLTAISEKIATMLRKR